MFLRRVKLYTYKAERRKHMKRFSMQDVFSFVAEELLVIIDVLGLRDIIIMSAC